ncbi:MAG TPA: hypothetical protein VFC03_16660, partial [Acidimicrobiales bacterium]|nr:hypothetical protein [Acidimicrobiales bacterium]
RSGAMFCARGVAGGTQNAGFRAWFSDPLQSGEAPPCLLLLRRPERHFCHTPAMGASAKNQPPA